MKNTMARIGARDALRMFSPIEFFTLFIREKTRCNRGSRSINLSAASASFSDQLPASLNESEAKKSITRLRPSGIVMFAAACTSFVNITFQLRESSMILANCVWASARRQGRQSPPFSRSIKNDAISSGFRAPPLNETRKCPQKIPKAHIKDIGRLEDYFIIFYMFIYFQAARKREQCKFATSKKQRLKSPWTNVKD